MKAQEAVEILEMEKRVIELELDHGRGNVRHAEFIKANEIAIKALQKNIPKKVTKTDTCSQMCPVCKMAVNYNYCGGCGQQLDYSI
jgi:hypothetical protein